MAARRCETSSTMASTSTSAAALEQLAALVAASPQPEPLPLQLQLPHALPGVALLQGGERGGAAVSRGGSARRR